MSEAELSTRGTAGQKNAATIAYRGNGLRPDWAAVQAGAHNVAANHVGSHKVIGAIGGILAWKLGLSKYFHFNDSRHLSVRMQQLIDASLERAPVASAVFEGI